MDEGGERIINTWAEAAADLGFTIRRGVRLSDGREVLLVVEGFGAPAGTAAVHSGQFWEYRDTAEQDGYYLSGLYPEGYGHYDRENFIATLNDWGWKGPEAERPDWCTDQPWGVEPWPPEAT